MSTGTTSAMKLRLVSAAHGARWIRSGALAVLRFPLAFASIFALGLFALMVAGFVPYLGQLTLLLLLPAGTLVFMIASRLASERHGPLPLAVVEVLRAPRAERLALLKLGVATLVAMAAAAYASHFIDHGVLWKFVAELAQAPSQSPSQAPLQAPLEAHASPGSVLAPSVAVNPAVQASLLLQMALFMLVSIPFWHAPALVHWGGYGWAPSMFFSTIAVWRNKAAFAVYGLSWLALMMAFSLALTACSALLGPVVATVIGVPTVLFGWTLFFTTRYFTFIDCFERTGADG